MLVCACEAVCARRVAEAAEQGAVHVDDVADLCGAGSRCGGCRPTIEQLLASFGLAGQPAA